MSTCTICSEVLSADLCATPCGHVFHHSCLAVWMRQKSECPLCKAACTSPQLTPLHFHPAQRLRDHQQQLSIASASEPSTAPPAPSLFALSLRLQSLRAELDAARLLHTQHTEAIAGLTSQLSDLDSTLPHLQASESSLSADLTLVTAELDEARTALLGTSNSHRLMQRRRRTLHRQLLVLRCIRPVRAAWKEGENVDLDTLMRAEERRMSAGGGDRDEEAGARDAAVDLLMRVMIGEVQAQVEAVKRQYRERVTDPTQRLTEAQRTQERCQHDTQRLVDEKQRLQDELAALQAKRRRLGRVRKEGSAQGGHAVLSARSHALFQTRPHPQRARPRKSRSVSDGAASAAAENAAPNSAQRAGSGSGAQDEVIVLSD